MDNGLDDAPFLVVIRWAGVDLETIALCTFGIGALHGGVLGAGALAVVGLIMADDGHSPTPCWYHGNGALRLRL